MLVVTGKSFQEELRWFEMPREEKLQLKRCNKCEGPGFCENRIMGFCDLPLQEKQMREYMQK